MSNKVVVAGLLGFGLGLATGAAVLYFYGKKKEKSEVVEPVNNVEEITEEPKVDSPEEDKYEAVKEVSNYNELISDLQYRDQHDDDMAADPLTEEEQEILDDFLVSAERKEFKQRNWGKVEEISQQDFDEFLYQTGNKFEDWEGEDLYFFQDESYVTDAMGSVLTAERVAQNLGDLIDSTGFRNDTSREHLYIACYDVETIFDIRKVVSQTRDEFFA